MVNEEALKICQEIVIIVNGVSIILWIFLAIFPGVDSISLGDPVMGLRIIFLDLWFYCFAITLIIGIILRSMLKSEQNQGSAPQ